MRVRQRSVVDELPSKDLLRSFISLSTGKATVRSGPGLGTSGAQTKEVSSLCSLPPPLDGLRPSPIAYLNLILNPCFSYSVK
jgi:hypothetical protein